MVTILDPQVHPRNPLNGQFVSTAPSEGDVSLFVHPIVSATHQHRIFGHPPILTKRLHWSYDDTARLDDAGSPAGWSARRAAALIDRDGDVCTYCGIELDDDNRSVDHAQPRFRRQKAIPHGSNGLSNLVLACMRCNRAKADMTPELWARYLNLFGSRLAEVGPTEIIQGFWHPGPLLKVNARRKRILCNSCGVIYSNEMAIHLEPCRMGAWGSH